MISKKTKQVIEDILSTAGITINGNQPYDIRVNSDRAYERILRSGTLGAGESYMAGEWECDQIDELIFKLLRADLYHYVSRNWRHLVRLAGAKVVNHGRCAKAFEVGERHYDIGNDLYRHMLDKRMIYSCGYWKNATTLDQAQEDKLDLICRKIGLEKGMRVLDIGGGWGGLAKFVAERYGVSVVTVSVSKEQVAMANETCKGLPVENRLQDYRQLNEKFDRIISVGMFEHVGPKNYRHYFKVTRRCLNDDGLFLLHTITGLDPQYAADPWITKYIFPNGVIPSVSQTSAAAEGLFVIEDVHNFGADYDKTLMAWYENFVRAWPELKNSYNQTFYRMWRFYLLSCAGSFRARSNGLCQYVLSPQGVIGGYLPVR